MPIFGILDYVIVNWDTKKYIQKLRVLAWKFINSPLTQKPLDVRSWNLDTMWVLLNAFCKPSLGAPVHVTKISQAENGDKVDEFETIYLGKHRYWWKMVLSTLSTTFLLLCPFTPTWILFFLFCIFFHPFFFFFCCFLLLNRQTLCIQS